MVGGHWTTRDAPSLRERNRDVWLTTKTKTTIAITSERTSLNTLSFSGFFWSAFCYRLMSRAWQLAQIVPVDKKKGGGDRNAMLESVVSAVDIFLRWLICAN